MRNWGDESGLFWEAPIPVGRTSAGGAPRAPRARRIPPDPQGYKLPEYFDFARAKGLTIDIETSDPDLKSKGPGFRRDAYITGIGIRTADGQAKGYFPVRHARGQNLDEEQTHRWLRDGFNNLEQGTEVTGTNLMYDAEGLSLKAGVNFDKVKWRPVDWAEPLLDENQYTYNLGDIAARRLGKAKETSKLVQLYGDDYIEHFQDIHPGHAEDYVFGDLDLPAELLANQRVQLESEGLTELYDIECRLFPMLLYMRHVGVPVDIPAAHRFNDVLDQKVSEQYKTMHDMVGFDVNPNANASVARAFDQLGLTYPFTAPSKNHPNGQPSFIAEWLKFHSHPIAAAVQGARKYAKFKGTFVESYILQNAIMGRVYGQFNPQRSDDGGTVSGRFSSSNPNLQNIPVRDKFLGPLCRALFIPEPGQLWWSLDYSQIEYRLLVHYALLAKCMGADKAMQQYMVNPAMDFHQLVADLIGWEGKNGRDRAKSINFGFVYGMGVALLALQIGLVDGNGKPLPEAFEIFDKYHANAPFIKQVYNMASARANDIGLVKTILGRRRRFDLYEPLGYWEPDPDAPGRWRQTRTRQASGAPRPPAMHKAEAQEFYGTDRLKRAYTHKALNSVLQGSNADIMKKAMAEAWEAGCFGPGKPLQCHLTVHDELDGSMEDSPAGREALETLRQIMINAVPLKVPVLVSQGIGINWAEAK